jgi:hypothetical protein
MHSTRHLLTITVLAVSCLLWGQPAAWAAVGPGSCQTGTDVCLNLSGEVGADSCNGDFACRDDSGDVGDDSCTGVDACQNNEGLVGNNSCNGMVYARTTRGPWVTIPATGRMIPARTTRGISATAPVPGILPA